MSLHTHTHTHAVLKTKILETLLDKWGKIKQRSKMWIASNEVTEEPRWRCDFKGKWMSVFRWRCKNHHEMILIGQKIIDH